MPAEFYKVLHILGAFMVMAAYGGILLHGMNGGSKSTNKSRGAAMMFHGIGLTILLVAGFGLLARIGGSSPSLWGGWLYAKLVIWVILGGLIVLAGRRPDLSKPLWWAVPLLGATAAFLAIYKPF